MNFNTLSGRFAALTILFVVLAEAAILIPSLSNHRRGYLDSRLERAQIASLALLPRLAARIGKALPAGYIEEVSPEVAAEFATDNGLRWDITTAVSFICPFDGITEADRLVASGNAAYDRSVQDGLAEQQRGHHQVRPGRGAAQEGKIRGDLQLGISHPKTPCRNQRCEPVAASSPSPARKIHSRSPASSSTRK